MAAATEDDRGSFRPAGEARPGTSLARFIFAQMQDHPEATGEFTGLFQQIGLAAKIIQSRVSRAGLANVLGLTGNVNVQGEMVAKLDEFAHNSLVRSVEGGGHVCLLGSEEEEQLIVPAEPRGKYVLLFDPLDGSGNIDINASIGTIFAVYRRTTPGDGPGTLEDALQPGRKLVASGYIIYGSSTMLVYSTGDGVHGFTFDPGIGEFFLSHERIQIPARGGTYSVNEGNYAKWSDATRRWVDWVKAADGDGGRPYGHRYIGAVVADFHRTLLRGGIFAYPGDRKRPSGKLRLLYEAVPLAFLAEAAGGAASDGTTPILDIAPQDLHQRTPLFIGSRDDVADALRVMAG
ncbi:MAG TPA: class 1 fructose-bisphosphatase [Polyangiaceae bacterium LLY-WYZ-14_1]|nr:class 1 fructose-bisphosphatase [Polyangiaceae bacterium LLY-WYZ-14_1]